MTENKPQQEISAATADPASYEAQDPAAQKNLATAETLALNDTRIIKAHKNINIHPGLFSPANDLP